MPLIDILAPVGGFLFVLSVGGLHWAANALQPRFARRWARFVEERGWRVD